VAFLVFECNMLIPVESLKSGICTLARKMTSFCFPEDVIPYSPSSSVKNYLRDRVQSSMFLKPATNTEIKDYILDLNSNKACGYDEITR